MKYTRASSVGVVGSCWWGRGNRLYGNSEEQFVSMWQDHHALLESHKGFTNGHLGGGTGCREGQKGKLCQCGGVDVAGHLALLERCKNSTSSHLGWGNGLHGNTGGPGRTAQRVHCIHHMGYGKGHGVMGVVPICDGCRMVPGDADGKAWLISTV